jgi:secretory phospholipase A2
MTENDQDDEDDDSTEANQAYPFQARSAMPVPTLDKMGYRTLDRQLKRHQMFVEKDADGQPMTHRMVEIITAPNLVEVGPPKVLSCKVYGEPDAVKKKLSGDSAKEGLRQVTKMVMSSLVEKCQRHVLETISKRQKERNATYEVMPGAVDDILGSEETGEDGSEISDEASGGGNVLNRFVIYPGTKWCGAGNIAENYDDLGIDYNADSCCREHDHCNDNIKAGETRYNLTNSDQYTKSSCVCDTKFAACLKKANTYLGHQVGRAFFNVIQIQCFRKDFPIVRCLEKKGFGFNHVQTSCQSYELDESQEKKVQFFDPPFYDGDSGPLLYIPGISEHIAEPVKELKDKFLNGGLVGTVVG